MAALMAIVLFGETNHLGVKLASIAVILAGTLLMIERKDIDPSTEGKRGWLLYAVLAAVFAALTSILGKAGIDGVESNLGTAIRTCVVLVIAWVIVVARRKLPLVSRVNPKEGAFLALSGVATGASWLCYYYAIQTGVVGVVVQIDRLSVLVSAAFAWIALGEKLSRRSLAGLALLVGGTCLMAAFA